MTRRGGNGALAPPTVVITRVSPGIGHAAAKLAIAQDCKVFGRSGGDANTSKDEFGSSFTLAGDVAKTVMKALTVRRPRLRYAPSQHALLEQALPRAAPKRATDFVIEQALGLRPDPKRALKGIRAEGEHFGA